MQQSASWHFFEMAQGLFLGAIHYHFGGYAIALKQQQEQIVGITLQFHWVHPAPMKAGRVDLQVKLPLARFGLQLHRVGKHVMPKMLVAELSIVCSKTTRKRWVGNRPHPPLCGSFQGVTSNLW